MSHHPSDESDENFRARHFDRLTREVSQLLQEQREDAIAQVVGDHLTRWEDGDRAEMPTALELAELLRPEDE